MGERSGKDPQPSADIEGAAPAPASGGGAAAASEYAGAMGNQAFGRALEAAHGADEQQLARLPFGMPTAPAAAQGARGLFGGVRDAVDGAADAVLANAPGAAIDKAALAGRVRGIASSR